MTLLPIVVLCIIQGITEFLPVSSSAHLILIPNLMAWPDQQLVIDVATHVGTLLAVILYFWRDCLMATRELFRSGIAEKAEPRILGRLFIATLPILFVGFFVKELIATDLRSVALIGWTMLGFGIILFLADRYGVGEKKIQNLTHKQAWLIGIAQVLALVPGVSRSGITMTASLFIGTSRSEAARFSMLLAIPTIGGAGALVLYELLNSGVLLFQKQALLAVGLSFLVALLAISVFMSWLRRASLLPFVIYRVVLGGGLIIYSAW